VLAVSVGSLSVLPGSGSSAQVSGPVSAVEERRRRTSADAARLAPVVERARLGDAEAFGQLYDHYHASVYRIIYGQTRSTPLTEDLTADTFFRALRGIKGFKLDAALFPAWLFRIARNLVIDHFKASRNRYERAQDMSRYEDLADDADGELIALLDRERVRAAMAELPTGQRRVIELRFLGELTTSEVADLLDTTEGAVKQLQFRGLRNLARTMRE
jgi:RNA polymerase sigma-70 factor (ECF subfamily)